MGKLRPRVGRSPRSTHGLGLCSIFGLGHSWCSTKAADQCGLDPCLVLRPCSRAPCTTHVHLPRPAHPQQPLALQPVPPLTPLYPTHGHLHGHTTPALLHVPSPIQSCQLCLGTLCPDLASSLQLSLEPLPSLPSPTSKAQILPVIHLPMVHLAQRGAVAQTWSFS